MIRIVQLTDIHIPSEGEYPYGIDIRSQFTTILAEAVSFRPDLLVISGDLCFMDGDAIVYGWIKSHLDETGIPYSLIAGNHDHTLTLAKSFGLEKDLNGDELYFEEILLHRYRCIFLDTALGKCSPAQWDWFSERLKANKLPSLIFMHHPPLAAGVVHMDNKYPFKEIATFIHRASEIPQILHVFCGHYHVERSLSYKNIQVHITPSTFFTLNPESPTAEIIHHDSGFRVIEMLDQELIRHWVHYSSLKKLP